jgi:O-antigen/teichoic acid export membrane protein
LLQLWTGDPVLAGEVAPLAAALVIGTLCNALAGIPYQMQLAHGWTSLSMKINLVAIIILAPGLYIGVNRYGPLGAAVTLLALNAVILFTSVHFFHSRLLRGELRRWYTEDVAAPLLAAGCTAFFCWWLLPRVNGQFGQVAVIVISTGCTLVAAVLAAPAIRRKFLRRYYRPHKLRSQLNQHTEETRP